VLACKPEQLTVAGLSGWWTGRLTLSAARRMRAMPAAKPARKGPAQRIVR